MKSPLVLVFALILTATSVSAKEKSASQVHVLSTRMNIFYFKVSKEMIGAKINVFSEAGENLITATIEHRKTIVDFYNEEPGHYTIEIVKGGVTEHFHYVKTEPSPLIPIESIATDLDLIKITFFKTKKTEKWYC